MLLNSLRNWVKGSDAGGSCRFHRGRWRSRKSLPAVLPWFLPVIGCGLDRTLGVCQEGARVSQVDSQQDADQGPRRQS